jgi:hypothetical protein
MPHLTYRSLNSCSPAPLDEMHEIADVRFSLANPATLIVNVDTASQFVDQP